MGPRNSFLFALFGIVLSLIPISIFNTLTCIQNRMSGGIAHAIYFFTVFQRGRDPDWACVIPVRLRVHTSTMLGFLLQPLPSALTTWRPNNASFFFGSFLQPHSSSRKESVCRRTRRCRYPTASSRTSGERLLSRTWEAPMGPMLTGERGRERERERERERRQFFVLCRFFLCAGLFGSSSRQSPRPSENEEGPVVRTSQPPNNSSVGKQRFRQVLV